MSEENPFWFSTDMTDLEKIQSDLWSLQRDSNSVAQTLQEDKKSYLNRIISEACYQFDFNQADRIVTNLRRYLPEEKIDGNLKQVQDYSSKIEELEQTIRDEISTRVNDILRSLAIFRSKFANTPVPLNQYFVSYAHRLVK